MISGFKSSVQQSKTNRLPGFMTKPFTPHSRKAITQALCNVFLIYIIAIGKYLKVEANLLLKGNQGYIKGKKKENKYVQV